MPLLAVSLAGTTVICCIGMLLFPGNVQCYSHSIPSTPRLPVLLSVSLRVIHCPIHKLFSGKGDTAPGSLSFISPLLIIDRSKDGTGSGHRGNRKTALETMGCEVVMTTRKLLKSPYHLLPLLLHCSPAERERDGGRIEMELSSKHGGRKNPCGSDVCVCVFLFRGEEPEFCRACWVISIQSMRIRA